MKPAITIFDVDGVLVNPVGYRLGFKRTVCHFMEQMGWSCEFPVEEISECFEAHSAGSEWDMVPITIAIILESCFDALKAASVPDHLEQVVKFIKGAALRKPMINFQSTLDLLEPYFKDSVIPSVGLLAAAKAGKSGIFPCLGQTQLLESLLGNTRDFVNCLPNRVFENYVLGHELFNEYFGQPIVVDAPEMLLKADIPLLSFEACDSLRDLHANHNVRFTAVTYRPSLPPQGVVNTMPGYPPEAEMALAQVGVDFMTVMGFGRIRYLAQHLDISTEKLSKPSPVQSLAGIAACWSGEEWPAIQWAYNAYLRNQKPPHERGMLTAWDLPPSFQLHIFEDTIGGILAGQGAARLLRDLGYQVDVHVWGIAKNQAKYASLERAGARIFRNVNEAIMASRPVFLDG